MYIMQSGIKNEHPKQELALSTIKNVISTELTNGVLQGFPYTSPL